jgi:hypothetical protein
MKIKMIFLICLFNWFVFIGANQKPILQEIFTPKKLVENQTVRFNCDLLLGGAAHFSWYLNDEQLKENDKLKIKNREDTSSLMIQEISVDSNGIYRCQATNEYGSDSQKISIFVNCKMNHILNNEYIYLI